MRRIYILLIVISLVGCSRSKPQINTVFHQFNLYQNIELNIIEKRLSFFIQAEDEDGLDDIETIYILNDKNDFFWTLKEDHWYHTQRQGQDWIGSNSLVFPDNYDFTAKSFRVLCEDFSGAYAETRFTLNIPDNIDQEIEYPEIKIQDRKVQVISPVNEPMLWVYDLTKDYNSFYPVPKEGITIDSIIARKNTLQDGFSYNIYYYNDSLKIGVLSGPYYYTK